MPFLLKGSISSRTLARVWLFSDMAGSLVGEARLSNAMGRDCGQDQASRGPIDDFVAGPPKKLAPIWAGDVAVLEPALTAIPVSCALEAFNRIDAGLP